MKDVRTFKAPKVFISHAGDDQDRFVRGFAEKLIENGVDAWYSEWEMKPGDRLIEKIFDQGIADADAFLVVLSTMSVGKSWVREELDAALVSRIAKRTKIIPVVIEDCEIPLTLQSTLYETIRNLESYDDELKSVLAAIFGISEKPALGSPPYSFQQDLFPIPGLIGVDNLVLKSIYDYAVESGQDAFGVDYLWKRLEETGISRPQFEEALVILDEVGYIRGHRGDGRILSFATNLAGFHRYATAYVADIDRLYRRVASKIVNEEFTNSEEIAVSLSEPQMLVDYVLDMFENQGWLTVAKYLGGGSQIVSVSPQLKRVLGEWAV